MALEDYPTDPAPKRPYRSGPKFKTLVTEFGNGAVSRVSQWDSARRNWTLEYETDATGRATMEAFFIARLGRGEAFNFTCFSDGQTYVVMFDQDEFNATETDKNEHEFTLRLTETDE